MTTKPLLLSLLLLVAPGCDRKKPSEATSTTESASVAAARTDEDMLRAEIGKGLEEQLNVIMLPVGDIEIMGGLSSQMENSDFQRKRFKADYLNFLNDMKAKGLLTFTEQRQSELDAIGRMAFSCWHHQYLSSIPMARANLVNVHLFSAKFYAADAFEMTTVHPSEYSLL